MCHRRNSPITAGSHRTQREKVLLLPRQFAQTETVNKTLVTTINHIDQKETLLGRLEYSLLKQPYTSEHKTLNMIIVNGYSTCLEPNVPQVPMNCCQTRYIVQALHGTFGESEQTLHINDLAVQ